MRILVLSDSHGRPSLIEKAIISQPQAEHIFFLGDCTRDIDAVSPFFCDKKFHIVKGNCDFSSEYPEFDRISLQNCNIFFCHGHSFSVKGSTERLQAFAKNMGAKIALFGHTHCSHTSYDNGLYIINPGSVALPRNSRASYAVIDICQNGIMPIIINL